MSSVKQKTCTKCSKLKPVKEFSFSKRGKFGVRSICRECGAAVFAEWRQKAVSKYDPSTVPPSKICRKCHKRKPASDFVPSRATKDGLASWCRKCHSKDTLIKRNAFYDEIRKIKESNACVVCKKCYPYWIMQFDHLPKYKKICQISGGVSAGVGGKKTVISEIQKCEVICANCHLNRTHVRKYPETAGRYKI